MVFQGKRLLILGGAIQCLKAVTAAKEMGIYTIVTDIHANPQVAEAADETLSFSVMDVDGLHKWCLEHPVDGVLNYCIDYAQKTHQQLCQHLGLPSYGTAEQYHVLTDKTAFKNFCVKNGVDVIPQYDENCLEQVELPVLVKPAESSGSRGVAICYTKAELTQAIRCAKEVSRNGKVIIEKYMGGKQDFTVTYLIVSGQPCLIRIGDRYLGRVEDGLNRQCICTVTPSEHTGLYMSRVHERIVQMLKNLGLQNGAVFFQGFIDGDTVRLYDPGIRFPGGEYDRLLYATTGVNAMQAVIGYALSGTMHVNGESLSRAYTLNGKVAVQLTVAAKAGTISVYDGFDRIREMPGVVYVARKAAVGATIPASGDVKQRVVEIAYIAEDHATANRFADKIYDALVVLDEHGNDMVVSKYHRR